MKTIQEVIGDQIAKHHQLIQRHKNPFVELLLEPTLRKTEDLNEHVQLIRHKIQDVTALDIASSRYYTTC